MASASPKPSDAVALLKADHRKVEELFERYEGAKSVGPKQKLAQEICLELSVHTSIEEEIFYPAIKGVLDEETHDEAYVEHDAAKALIAELLAGSPDDDFYDAKVKVLSEMIKHHVKEEEQPGGMFAQAKAGKADLRGLGTMLAARKQELTAQMKSGGIPTPATRARSGPDLEQGAPTEFHPMPPSGSDASGMTAR